MTEEQNDMNPSLEAALYSVRETIKAMALLDAEAERLFVQRIALSNKLERGVGAILFRMRNIKPPPLRDFPELNHKDG